MAKRQDVPVMTLEIAGQQIKVDITDMDRFEIRDAAQAWAAASGSESRSTKALLEALGEVDLDAVAAIAWITARREDPSLRFEDVNLTVGDFMASMDEAEAPEG